MLDVALLVPFQPRGTSWVDPTVRSMFAAPKLAAIRARDRFFEHLGLAREGAPLPGQAHRSLTAVALATSLARAGLSWRVLDPGTISLGQWRMRLEELRKDPPRLVGISSTFVDDGYWLASLCALVRRILPEARIAIGGYFYATDAKQFLSLDADILCVGEGEVRVVSITRAVRNGAGLDDIPGLYLRDAAGRLRYTGDVEPLRLDELPLPDWSLSPRIEPAVDATRESILRHVETQRGCVFKCEFCTFRTLAAPVAASVARGVDAILDAGRGPGAVWVVDGTATYPRDRWRQLLESLIERGGSPIGISAYARVTDLDDEVCALMARAGVRYVLIGQESGDQRILNAIRKGTRVDHLRPAIAALGRHGIEPGLSFMYGFPGENEESLRTTRHLIRTLNEGHEATPVVRRVTIQPFAAQDFAGVQQRGTLGGAEHRYGWDSLAVSPTRAAEECLDTYVELSKIPHAPITAFDGIVGPKALFEQQYTSDPRDLFRLAKALDRGIGLFAEAEMDGKRPNAVELARLSAELVPKLRPVLANDGPLRKAAARVGRRAKWFVMQEWVREQKGGIGPFTRLALGFDVARVTREPMRTVEAVRSGRYPTIGLVGGADDISTRKEAADRLVRLGVATGKRRLARAG